MRILSAVIGAFVLSFPLIASADEISAISPSQLNVGDVETFIAIRGTGLAGSESTAVVFAGPGGQFTVEASNASDSLLEVFVPVEVAITEGRYTIDVFATDVTGLVRHIGPAFFDVVSVPVVGAPQLSMSEVQVAEAVDGTGADVVLDVSASSQGGTGLTLTCDHASGSHFPIGSTLIACTATDSAGSTSGSFTLVVTDSTSPVVTVPGNITTTNPVVTFIASATDNIDGPVPVTCDPVSGSTFDTGKTTVLCTALDAHLNLGVATFDVIVSSGPPVLTVPADIAAEATGPNGAVVRFTATATNDGVVTCTPASGSTFPFGRTQVNCTATNVAGSVSGSVFVTVADHTPPAIITPGNLVVEADSPFGSIVRYTVTASDLVDGSRPVSCTPPSPTLFALGTKTVVCTSSDLHGNTGTATFNVTVRDTTAPEIVLVQPLPSFIWPADHRMVDVVVLVVSIDKVDFLASSRIVSVTSNQPVTGPGDTTTPDWIITGPYTVKLRAERTNDVERVYTITVESFDKAGNTSTGTATVKVANGKGRVVR
jgi:hypothetical protein